MAEKIVDRVEILELPNPELHLPIDAREFVKKNMGLRRWVPRYWPDLVVHTEPWPQETDFLLALREASPKRTRIVRLEDTNHRRDEFDLVVNANTEKYHPGANVIHTTGVATRVTAERARAEAERWRNRLGTLPRPITMVSLGGAMDFTPFLDEWAVDLRRRLLTLHATIGGSLLLMASRRTPPSALAALASDLRGIPYVVYDARRDGDDNPYLAGLYFADRVVSTGDSLSMMSDALVLGKPLFVYAPAWSLEAQHARLIEDLYVRRLARPFVGDEAEARRVTPVNAAEDIAHEIRSRFCELSLRNVKSL